MKSQLFRIIFYTGLGITLFMLFKSRTSEDLVTESASPSVSTLDYDAKIAKIPFETATFGMG